MSPANGVALNTTFTVTAEEGFSDPDGDEIQYAFIIKSNDSDGVVKVMPQAIQADSTLELQLPSG